MATGFQAHNDTRPMDLRGRDGISIDDAWAKGPRAYRTTAIPGFPNLFTVLGPSSPGRIDLSPVQRPPSTGPRPRPRCPRAATGSHRPPPPRLDVAHQRQRALLAGPPARRALAIIIAVLIVVNAQDKRDQPAQQETSTSTTVIGVPPSYPQL